eukprot:UN03101
MSSDFDYLLKVVMVGDSGVGKSSLLKRFSSREFTGDYISTIGVDFEIKTLEVDNKRSNYKYGILQDRKDSNR